MQLPAKAVFFCPDCVVNNQIKIEPTGEPVQCQACSNLRVITAHDIINELTENYVKITGGRHEIKSGTFYLLLMPEIYYLVNTLTDFNEFTDIVRSARFIKDRFFFNEPIPKSIIEDSFFSELAWIPK